MLNKIKSLLSRLFRLKTGLELSYSKISAYRFCPWKYKLVYVDGLRVPPNPYISLGQTVHKTLEDFHKDKPESLEKLLEIYNRVWVNEGFQNPQQTLHFYDKGERMLHQYFEWFTDRKSEIVAIEKEFRFPVGTRMLRGIIDRIDRLPDGSYEVIDYKTHAEMWEKSRIDSDTQLTFYALGCKQIVGADPSSLSYFFLAHNKLVTTQRSSAQKEEALSELKQVARKIEQNDFTPNTTQCPKCDFKQSCKFSTARSAAQNGRSR